MDPPKLLKLFGFRILQDGRELPVETCVADFGAAPGQLVLHFRHQLSFTPDGTSVVSVTCAMPTRSAVSAEPTATRSPGVSRQFTWNYMLETASSWKDTLGRIVLAVSPGLHPDLDAPWQNLGTALAERAVRRGTAVRRPSRNGLGGEDAAGRGRRVRQVLSRLRRGEDRDLQWLAEILGELSGQGHVVLLRKEQQGKDSRHRPGRREPRRASAAGGHPGGAAIQRVALCRNLSCGEPPTGSTR